MELTPAQAKIAIDPHRFRVLCCGRRFGKTTLAIDQIKACAASGPKRIAYIAPTFQQARDIAWEELKRDCHKAAIQINETRLEIKMGNVKGSESLIILRGWEAIETLRGQKFDFIVIDEVASMRNFWPNWLEVIRPTLTDTRGEAMFISTPKGFNHFYDLYNIQDRDGDFASFHFSSYDNPHLPVDELDKSRKELPEDQFAQEYLADFRKTQGLVYKDFNRSIHTYNDGEESGIGWVERLVPVDFGYTNPTAMYLIRKDRDSHYWIDKEYYQTGKTTPEIIEIAKSYRGNRYYPDPAEPDRIEEMKRALLNTVEVSKDVEAGISAVQQLLKTQRLHIHVSCVNLINEFETYRYPDRKPDQNEKETPIKENDHGLDAIRYALYMQEGDFETLMPAGIVSHIPNFEE
jgi:PBSX family phage terminase large subunit